MKKILFLAFANCLALLGCMKDNTSPENQGTVGSAQIRFPVVPDAALKAAAKTSTSPARPMPTEPLTFTITIEGPGMAARTQTWDVNTVSGKTITLENIPSGPGRIFRGILTQYNMTTHEGSYTVDIGGGQSVFVPLVLRDVRNGRAEICVEVEGWAGSPNCVPIDTLPEDTLNINGCWKFTTYGKDSVLKGDLNLSQYGGYLSGYFTDSYGRGYQVTGVYQNHAWDLTMMEPRFELDYMTTPMPEKTMLIGDVFPGDKPSTHPVDTNWAVDTTWGWPVRPRWPMLYVKVDVIGSGATRLPSSYFKGALTDSTFQARLGDASAIQVGCITDTLPPVYPPYHPIDSMVYIDDMPTPR